ncbi:MAG: response regulator [Alphaproteobacteria bacterium]|nr:response regulator [Alphaproteobacteria bacterium]
MHDVPEPSPGLRRSPSDLRLGRWVLVVMAIAFPGWWIVMRPDEDATTIDSLPLRLVVTSLALASVGASFARDRWARQLATWSTLTATVMSVVAVVLAWLNPDADLYLWQLVATIGVAGLVIRDGIHVRWYWTGVAGAFAVALGWSRTLPAHAPYLATTMITVFLLHWVVAVREELLQDQILERTTLLREIFENATDVLVLLDPRTNRILLANQRAAEVFGARDVDALLDQDGLRLPARPLTREELEAIWHTNQGGDDVRLEIPFRTFHGIPFWGDAAWRSIDVGNRRYTLLRIDRIDERIRAQQQLEAARDAAEAATVAKSNFLANMSHEIRTPLNGVLGLASLLAQTRLTPDQQAYVSTIITSGDTLRSLIDELLDFSRIEAGELVIVEEPFDLRQAMHELDLLFRSQAAAKDLPLRFEVDPNIPEQVVTDGKRLKQVVVNLLGNALKFTDEGLVALHVGMANRVGERLWLRFEVSDTGIGIDESDLPRLFEPFSQGDPGISRRYGGTGLGLAICKTIAARLGGRLTARSRLGEGSTFVFELPVRSAAAPPIASVLPQGGTDVPVDRRRPVLVAEDNPVNQMVVVEMLRRQGCDVDTARDGEEAVRAATQRTYDVVFMDVMMPGMDGLEATRRLRELDLPRRPYVVALTAGVLPGDREKCVKAGMDDFVAKPVNMEELAGALQRASQYERRVRAGHA